MTPTETHSRVMQVLALAKDMDASEAKQALRIFTARIQECLAQQTFEDVRENEEHEHEWHGSQGWLVCLCGERRYKGAP